MKHAGIVAISLALLCAPSAADDGTFQITLDEVSNNCSGVGMTMAKTSMMVRDSAKAVRVEVQQLPIMIGSAKGPKLKAASEIGPTTVAGLDGKFSISGTISADKVSVLLVAEYFVKGKSVCTQTWNVKGARN